MSNKPELSFDRFWLKYPRRDAKKDATKVWIQLDPDDALIDTILEALEWQCELWADMERRFIPLPATYIRGERWTDEKPTTQTTRNPTIDQLPAWQQKAIRGGR